MLDGRKKKSKCKFWKGLVSLLMMELFDDEPKYSKEAILLYFEDERLLLDALLDESKQYSVNQVKDILDEWRKGGVH